MAAITGRSTAINDQVNGSGPFMLAHAPRLVTKAETNIKKGDKEGVAILIGENIYLGEVTGMRGNITKG